LEREIGRVFLFSGEIEMDETMLGYRPPEEYERLLAENGSQECIMAKTISI